MTPDPSFASGSFFDRVIDLYEEAPYPNAPIEQSAKDSLFSQFSVNLTTAQYARTHAVVDSEGAIVLNAGCGSGWETLILAEANPGAKIVAFDLSIESVKVTERRLNYHGFRDHEVFVLDLLDLPKLGMTFDLITCNDVLYLLDDPVAGLTAMREVLAPEGILRTNLHNVYTRRSMLDMQEAFRILGLYDIPRREAAKCVREFMSNLTGLSSQRTGFKLDFYKDDTSVLNNYLLSGDKGFSMNDTFRFLREAGLGMVNLVDFPTWNIKNLFKEMPSCIADKIDQLSQQQLLHLFELIYPNGHRLIDFWAEHVDSSILFPWTDEQWMDGTVQLNPVIYNNPTFLDLFPKAAAKPDVFTVPWSGSPNSKLIIPPEKVVWLVELLQGPTPVKRLIQIAAERNETSEEESTEAVLTTLQSLEDFLFVLLDA